MNKKITTKKTPVTKKTPLAKQDKQSDSVSYAKMSLSPVLMGAILVESFSNAILPKADITDVTKALRDKTLTVQDGDMKPIEAMLIGQAQALQSMFVSLCLQAENKSQLNQYTAFMNLALKAQAQSRATIQALTELKYPKQTNFVKQANIANGHQQINNNQAASDNVTNTHAPTHAKENQHPQNELLERQNNEWLDNAKTATPSATYQAMATVATQHRRTNA
jgi:putative sterol carrier protein